MPDWIENAGIVRLRSAVPRLTKRPGLRIAVPRKKNGKDNNIDRERRE